MIAQLAQSAVDVPDIAWSLIAPFVVLSVGGVLLVTITGYTLFTGLTAFSPNDTVFLVCQFFARAFGAAELALAAVVVAEEIDKEHRGWALGVLGTWQEIWRQYFPESPLDERETADLMRYAVSVLSGLATTNILEGRGRRRADRSLARLKDTLLRELRPG